MIATAGGVPDRLIVVADCCVETWLLGHRKIVARNPESRALRDHLAFYDVINDDPERMDRPGPTWPTRAGYHCEYLQEVFRERNLSFTKKHPGFAADKTYLKALQERVADTPHLRSFAELLALTSFS